MVDTAGHPEWPGVVKRRARHGTAARLVFAYLVFASARRSDGSSNKVKRQRRDEREPAVCDIINYKLAMNEKVAPGEKEVASF